MSNITQFRSGFVSIVGPPNVGKSTLLNRLIGTKVSIVSPRPQTTRNRTLGVRNIENGQIVFVDTPGIYRPSDMLDRFIVNEAFNSLSDVDIVYLVVSAFRKDSDIETVIGHLKELKSSVFLLINKIDRVDKRSLLPLIAEYSKGFEYSEIVPISALKGDGIDKLLNLSAQYLKEGPPFYPDDIYTDQQERFMVSEIIREKLMKNTYEEVPTSLAVDIQKWKAGKTSDDKKNRILSIYADIYIEKETQKGIIIGGAGSNLKRVGIDARKEIEDLLGCKVYLKLFAKVRKNWRRDPGVLKELGFN